MTKSSWAVAVTAFFTVVTSITPIPESYRHLALFVAWYGLAISILAWIVTHNFENTENKSILLSGYILAGIVGAGFGVLVWYLTDIADDKTVQEVKNEVGTHTKEDSSTASPSKNDETPGGAISCDCDPTSSNIVMPAEGVVNWVDLTEVRAQYEGAG